MDRHTPERFENFEAAIRTLPQVLECSLVTGMDADYQLKVVVPDMDHYQKLLLGHLTRIEGVTSVRSSFVLNQVLEQHRTAADSSAQLMTAFSPGESRRRLRSVDLDSLDLAKDQKIAAFGQSRSAKSGRRPGDE